MGSGAGSLRAALRPPWASRTLTLVWSARVSISAGRALAGVVAPLYLAALGFRGLELGELFVGVALASAVLSAGVGLLSDRVGRKPFLIVFPMLTAAAAVVFATVQSVPVGAHRGGRPGQLRPRTDHLAGRQRGIDRRHGAARGRLRGRLVTARPARAASGYRLSKRLPRFRSEGTCEIRLVRRQIVHI